MPSERFLWSKPPIYPSSLPPPLGPKSCIGPSYAELTQDEEIPAPLKHPPPPPPPPPGSGTRSHKYSMTVLFSTFMMCAGERLPGGGNIRHQTVCYHDDDLHCNVKTASILCLNTASWENLMSQHIFVPDVSECIETKEKIGQFIFFHWTLSVWGESSSI